MNKKFAYLFLFFLISAICFSPRFSLGYLPSTGRSIDIRAEDILIFLGTFFLILAFFASGKTSFKKPPLFWPIFSWIAFGFFSILVNLLLQGGNLGIFFFYFLKEIEFFILYLLVFHCLNKVEGVRLIKYWIIFYLVNIAWLLYVFLYDVEWSKYYGPNTFMEPQGPFPSGGFFLIIFIFLFNIFIFYQSKLKISGAKKLLIFIFCIIPIFGILASGSYTAIVGLVIALVLSSGIYFTNRVGIARLIKTVFMVLLVMIAVFQLIHIFNLTEKISKTKVLWEYGSNNPVSRIGILNQNISHIIQSSVLNILVGFGILGEAHSQYMRVFLERGLIGFLIFAWLIWSLLVTSYRGMKDKNNLYKRSLSTGLFVATISMLVMSVPNDAFMVVKVAEVYWFFAAMTLVTIAKSNKTTQVSNARTS